MGFLSFLEKFGGEEAILEKAKKSGIDTAEVMAKSALMKSRIFAGVEIKPFSYARMSIYSRPRWKHDTDGELYYKNQFTGLKLIEGTSILDTIKVVISMEFDGWISDTLPIKARAIQESIDVACDYIRNYYPQLL